MKGDLYPVPVFEHEGRPFSAEPLTHLCAIKKEKKTTTTKQTKTFAHRAVWCMNLYDVTIFPFCYLWRDLPALCLVPACSVRLHYKNEDSSSRNITPRRQCSCSIGVEEQVTGITICHSHDFPSPLYFFGTDTFA